MSSGHLPFAICHLPTYNALPEIMLCDECKNQPATVFLTQIIEGKMTKRNMCNSCAAPMLGQMPQGSSYGPNPASLQHLAARPSDCPDEVVLSDPITVRNLASALHAQFYNVIAVLMQHGIFKLPDDALDFATASLVCAHYGVTPYKAA